MTKQTSRQIIDRILSWPDGTRIYILAPIVKDKKGEHKYIFEALKKAGYQRVRVDGKIYDIEEELDLDKKKKHYIEVMVDRMIVEPENAQRLAESIENALNLGEGAVFIQNAATGEEQIFSQNFVCLECGINLPEVQPRNFSFNSPHGACSYCTGLGVKLEIDPDLVIPNKKLSLSEGAIRPWARTTSKATWYSRMLEAIAENYGFSVDTPVADLPKEAMQIVLYGSNGNPITIRNSKYDRVPEFETAAEGVIHNLERRHKETDSEYIRKEIEKYMAVRECPQCHGNRLKPEVLAIKVGKKSIMEVAKLSINQAIDFFKNVKLDEKEKFISHQIIKEILERLQFLLNVGLEYLTLDRAAGTLSGGEAQRIRLATQIGSSLMGVLYILDEPSIGLHQRDNIRLIGTLKRLRDLGNTVIVVEHDAETIMESDHVIDIGPGAGEHGGEVVSEGTPEDIVKDKKSLTGQYLSGTKKIALPEKRRKGNGKEITIVGAEENNLKNVTVSIPLGKFVVVSGVSGSGKSSLINDILAKKLSQVFHRAQTVPGKHKEIMGTKNLDKVINIDQSPIGRTPRLVGAMVLSK